MHITLTLLRAWRILNVTVYDPLRDDSQQITYKVSEHELITITSSEVDWAHVLSSKMEKQRGKLLITGSIPSTSS
ncbi:hypothetical protein GB937_010314 [Aspergillus fischeri]|nr:hypothetical protein GB937_010314 [Aspergillus fischeri]